MATQDLDSFVAGSRSLDHVQSVKLTGSIRHDPVAAKESAERLRTRAKQTAATPSQIRAVSLADRVLRYDELERRLSEQVYAIPKQRDHAQDRWSRALRHTHIARCVLRVHHD
jgi:hypothetical protein